MSRIGPSRRSRDRNGPPAKLGRQPANEAVAQDRSRRWLCGWIGWAAAASWRHGEAIVSHLHRPRRAILGTVQAGDIPELCSSLGSPFPAAAERELTDRALYVEFEPRHFCKQIDVAGADGAAAKAHVGRCQVERLDHGADILQDQRVCD